MRIDWKGVLIVLLIILLGWQVLSPNRVVKTKTEIEYRDSLVYDTIKITEFRDRLVCKEIVRTDTLIHTINDTDTVFVPIPISEYHFRDSLYSIKAEGYNVSLQEVEVYPKTIYKFKETTHEIVKRKRITHGLQIGAGAMYGTKGLDFGFYGGYGVTINF